MKYIIIIWCLFVTINTKGQSNQIKRSYITPKRVLWQSSYSDNILKNVDQLLKPGIHQADLFGGGNCEMMSTEDHKASIILDFGKEIQGGIQLVTGAFDNTTPIKLRLRFGESVSETMSNIGEDGATNEHSMRDFEVKVPWMGKVEYGSTGFRFLRIDLLDSNRKLQLKEISAISELRDIPYLGSFECNDSRLNKIWKTGAYTVHLNMQEYLWDGIKRDRLVWVGDMHPEVMTIINVFGYNDVVPKTLDYIRSVTPADKWMNSISSYSMWWVIIQKELYMATGNIKYLKEQEDYLRKLLKNFCAKVDKDGHEQLDGWRFLDWPTSGDKKSIKNGYQALLIETLRAGEYMLDALNEKEVKKLCRSKIKKMKKVTNIELSSKQVAALLSIANYTDSEKAADVILEGGSQNFSTFYGYYMLEALAKDNRYKEAIEIMKDYWGGMLDLGATSFWEDFNINWIKNAGRIDEMPKEGKIDVHRKYGDHCYVGLRHSFCHGWASGPTAWLSNHVLGVHVLEPGCKKICIKPNLGELTWVKGSYPTPLGVINIEHRKIDGKVETKVDAPRGVKIVY
ncbi:hypothetical protein K4L44_15625 [Halosquirtibacter laminarini]|uniref:Uncharacterized protein n=1 Tax=Halosquirtibacter laminarini TaxID=3374600 RepID=A0AC61NED0_9BACT|nr:hypothetical protein K4L44_15625 [Prolixibacteraceae bacterium]